MLGKTTKFFVCLLIAMGPFAFSEKAHSSFHTKRQQHFLEGKRLIGELEARADKFDKLYKKVLSGNGGSVLSSEQVDMLKYWIRGYTVEYNRTHEALLDAEDQVHLLDRKIAGKNKSQYMYTQLSDKREQILNKAGTKYTKQKVELITYLENEQDAANKRLSGSLKSSSKDNSTWQAIRAIMNEPISKPVVAAPKPAPSKQWSQRPLPPAVAEAVKMPPPKTLPKKPMTLPPVAATPSVQEIESPMAACERLPKSHLSQFRDVGTNFQYLIQGTGKLAQYAFAENPASVASERYYFFSKLLPVDFFEGKFASKKLKHKEKKKLNHLKYLSRVRLIHLFDNGIKNYAGPLYQKLAKRDLNEKTAAQYFADANSSILATQWLGGKRCRSVRSSPQARGKCQLMIRVRYGDNFACLPKNRDLAKVTFDYIFQFSPSSKRWVLADVYAPVAKQKGIKFRSSSVALFTNFRNRAYSSRENISSMEGWIQRNLPTGDLLGFDDFLKNKRSFRVPATKQKSHSKRKNKISRFDDLSSSQDFKVKEEFGADKELDAEFEEFEDFDKFEDNFDLD